jgi:two-component system, LytTR family, sensor kinase
LKMVRRHADEERELDKRTLVLVAVFWVFHYLIATIRAPLIEMAEPADLAARRLLSFGAGMLLCYAVTLPLRRYAASAFWHVVVVGVSLALLASVVHAGTHMLIYLRWWPVENIGPRAIPFSFAGLLLWTISWLNAYMAFIAVYLALLYSFDVRTQGRRLSTLQALTHDAQVRSLRYQINPHLLFNALNSVSALVMDGKNRDAESMLMRLSKFYRASLATDPSEDIPLADELRLQTDYLAIEKLRFEDRLSLDIDVPKHLGKALVPAMILQPLVENAVKHGVASQEATTAVRIAAWTVKKNLHLAVINSPAASGSTERGAGVGLENVRQRLFVRYGSSGRLTTQHEAPNRFQAEICLPLQLGK